MFPNRFFISVCCEKFFKLLITFLISNKKEFNHFFKSRSSDIVLLKLGNLHQSAKRYEARNTEREERSSYMSEREARRPLGHAMDVRIYGRSTKSQLRRGGQTN